MQSKRKLIIFTAATNRPIFTGFIQAKSPFFEVEVKCPVGSQAFTMNAIQTTLNNAYSLQADPKPAIFALFAGNTITIPSQTILDIRYEITAFYSDYSAYGANMPCCIGRFPTDDPVQLRALCDLSIQSIPPPPDPLSAKMFFLAGTKSDFRNCTWFSTTLKQHGYNSECQYIIDRSIFTAQQPFIFASHLIFYMGHGSFSGWCPKTDQRISAHDFPPLASPPPMRHIFSFACNCGIFSANASSLGIDLLLQGKTLTFFGASTTCYEDHNCILARKILDRYHADRPLCIGELLHFQVSSFPEDNASSFQAAYNLLGDPTIFIRPPVPAD